MWKKLAAPLAVMLISACNYSFRAGSFPPPDVKTIAIEPFDNKTDQFEVAGELYTQMLKQLPGALGLRTAGAGVANAVVKGTIESYQVQAPNYQAGGTGQAPSVIQRQVTITADVEIIDKVKNVVLWQGSVSAQGEFLQASQNEDVGRANAINLLVKKIVDGAQSNW